MRFHKKQSKVTCVQKGSEVKIKKKYNIPLKRVINRPMDKLGQQNSKGSTWTPQVD